MIVAYTGVLTIWNCDKRTLVMSVNIQRIDGRRYRCTGRPFGIHSIDDWRSRLTYLWIFSSVCFILCQLVVFNQISRLRLLIDASCLPLCSFVVSNQINHRPFVSPYGPSMTLVGFLIEDLCIIVFIRCFKVYQIYDRLHPCVRSFSPIIFIILDSCLPISFRCFF